MSGSFAAQFKHCSKPMVAAKAAHFRPELQKIRTLALAGEANNYLAITNMIVSATEQEAIRQEFGNLPGVESVLVLDLRWIEQTIDAHPRLRRLVPRLYGIGDLAQILSQSVFEQSAAVLEDLRGDLRTFVPTDSYRRVIGALTDHRMALLIGPPASGKSAIAANACMMFMAENPDLRVLRIEHAEQFKDTWVPSDPNVLYWIDDVFGETAFDSELLRTWSAALPKLEAATKRGVKVVLCTRDYVFREAQLHLKHSKLRLLTDAAIQVTVNDVSPAEREQIIYNHVKDGDVNKTTKSLLKHFLRGAARLPSFTPELARRLGCRMFFHDRTSLSMGEVERFFDDPFHFFSDVVSGLARLDRAALTLILMHGNELPHPVREEDLPETFRRSFGTALPDVRTALANLEGSLVKRSIVGTSASWRMHHPSMVDAIQMLLGQRQDLLEVFVESATVEAIVERCSLVEDSHRMFVPKSLYELLLKRFSAHPGSAALQAFLSRHASDDFLRGLVGSPVLLGALREMTGLGPFDIDAAMVLGARFKSLGMLPSNAEQNLLDRLSSDFEADCNLTAFRSPQVRAWIGDKMAGALVSEAESDEFRCFRRAFDHELDHLETSDEAEQLSAFIDRLDGELLSLPGLSHRGREQISELASDMHSDLDSHRDELIEHEGAREDYEYERWKDERDDRDDRGGMFSDVDE